jgi:diguanylate cyclase (GGDEF)-like protein
VQLRIRLKTRRDLWLFVALVTFISVAAAELSLGMLYFAYGESAFSMANAFYIAAIVPVVVALPTSYLTSRMALQLSRAHSRLQELAHTDELTGLTNRRSFFASSEQILETAQAEDDVAALLVLDADYFKQLNDTYGHATGDAALQFITQQLRACVRQTDLICRLGGEEFAILVAGMDEVGAGMLADRILDRIASQPLICDEKVIEMSMSCGIADTDLSYEMDALFKAADDALYAAKSSGRNRQVLYTHMPDQQSQQSSPLTH